MASYSDAHNTSVVEYLIGEGIFGYLYKTPIWPNDYVIVNLGVGISPQLIEADSILIPRELSFIPYKSKHLAGIIAPRVPAAG